jgi:hypothetical protein
MDELISQYTQIFKNRNLFNKNCFEIVTIDPVIPWMEGIIGCRIYSLGKTGTMHAKPPKPEIETRRLPQHLRSILNEPSKSLWFEKLSYGTKRLSKVLGKKFPMSNTLMRGPGDMLGTLMGYEQFIKTLMRTPDKIFLNELLKLCTQIWIKTAKIQFQNASAFKGGFCNPYGVWAPGLNIRFQEDITALLSPKLYTEWLLPYHVKIANSFEYSVFHMHSGSLELYNWRVLCKESKINCLQVDLDPLGPSFTSVLETLLEMNAQKPLIVTICTHDQIEAIENHLSEFKGSLAIFSEIELL